MVALLGASAGLAGLVLVFLGLVVAAYGGLANEDLREYLAGRKLRQKFWYTRFADLILDRLWKEMEDDFKLANPKP